MAAPLLEIRGLTINLPHQAERRHAVEDVSLEFWRNEILCVVGESGSGKTMMARSIMGLLPARVNADPSPDGNYHVCEHAGTIRCFFQQGQVKRDPLDGAKQPNVAQGLSRFLHSSHRPEA
jgi:ABC-type dipeptide/oligopeptide/nickel transport system ATPase subunit